jgi:hypothetical protein
MPRARICFLICDTPPTHWLPVCTTHALLRSGSADHHLDADDAVVPHSDESVRALSQIVQRAGAKMHSPAVRHHLLPWIALSSSAAPPSPPSPELPPLLRVTGRLFEAQTSVLAQPPRPPPSRARVFV